jgi:myo-inositol 2-dehydrogenase/D-chiro-inositol 1-dehydrogenase
VTTAPSSVPRPGGPASTGGPVRYGIVGAGMMGQEHLRNLRAIDGAVVTALADPHERSITDALGWFPAGAEVATFADAGAMVRAGVCDAVVIATPNHTHVDVLLDVLDTDLPVLVEKPLCTTVADCRRVIAAAAGRDAVVWVGLEYRYMPAIARVVRGARDGEVGRVRMVALREHRFPFLEKVGDWNRFSRNTGGTLVEKCCHFFDLMAHIVGERPVRVLASGAQDVNHLDEEYGGEVPDILDNAYVIVEFPGGARGMLDLCMFAEASAHQEELAVVGDVGKLEAFLPDSTVRFGRRADGAAGMRTETVHDPRVRHEGFHHGSSFLEHLDFLAAIRSGSRPAVGLDDGLWSVATGVAAHRSIDERRPVHVAEVLDE